MKPYSQADIKQTQNIIDFEPGNKIHDARKQKKTHEIRSNCRPKFT